MLLIASAALMAWAVPPAPTPPAAPLPAPTITMRWKASSGSPASPTAVAPVCQQIEMHKTGLADGAVVYDLAREPPADAIAAVLYTEGHCSKPIVVNRAIGASPKG